MQATLREGSGLDPNQLHDSTRDVPILNVQVSFFVPVRSVSTAESTFNPLVLGNVVVSTFGGIWIMAQNRDDGIGLVENNDASIQIGNRNEVTLDRD